MYLRTTSIDCRDLKTVLTERKIWIIFPLIYREETAAPANGQGVIKSVKLGLGLLSKPGDIIHQSN